MRTDWKSRSPPAGADPHPTQHLLAVTDHERLQGIVETFPGGMHGFGYAGRRPEAPLLHVIEVAPHMRLGRTPVTKSSCTHSDIPIRFSSEVVNKRVTGHWEQAMASNTPHKTIRRRPHTAQSAQKSHQIDVAVSEGAWQALQQISLHLGTALGDTIETLAIDAELRIRIEKRPENDFETG